MEAGHHPPHTSSSSTSSTARGNGGGIGGDRADSNGAATPLSPPARSRPDLSLRDSSFRDSGNPRDSTQALCATNSKESKPIIPSLTQRLLFPSEQKRGRWIGSTFRLLDPTSGYAWLLLMFIVGFVFFAPAYVPKTGECSLHSYLVFLG